MGRKEFPSVRQTIPSHVHHGRTKSYIWQTVRSFGYRTTVRQIGRYEVEEASWRCFIFAEKTSLAFVLAQGEDLIGVHPADHSL